DEGLLHRADGGGGEPRFAMLETVRAFAGDELARCGEDGAAHAAHAAYFAALAERIDPPLSGAPPRPALAVLEREHANGRAALAWLAQTGDAGHLLRLAAAASYSWEVHGRWTEGTAWLERALAADPRPSPARATALRSLGTSAGYLGDFA